jgi:hypothetical protein
MFLRRCNRKKNGKPHSYWALVESYRTARGSRQRMVAYVGGLKNSERSGWAQVGRRLEGQPPSPGAAKTAIGQVIGEAVELAWHKAGAERVNAQVHISKEVKDVLVDSTQVVVAVANIIANSIESHADPTGPVKITAEQKEGVCGCKSTIPAVEWMKPP